MSPDVAPAHPQDRLRFGWVFAVIWLVFLANPLSAVVDSPGGWRRDLGLAALTAFCVVYVAATVQIRGGRLGRGPMPSVRASWSVLLVLGALVACVVPGAGQSALAGLVYLAALGMMTLPLRPAWGLSALLFVLGQGLPYVVAGWQDTGNGLAVLLGSLATWGVRLASERNRRLVEAQEENGRLALQSERARIAADLHDILGHSLTVVAVKAELAQRLLDVDVERARAELLDLEVLARDALRDVRATALGTRGVSLPGEIAAAREALAAAGVVADLPTVADEVPSRWRELFAWTVREAVTNLLRHSGASRCEVRLTPCSVEVLDNGVGAAAGPAGGQGLSGLRRRADALQARLLVGDRADGPGFRVRVEVPS